MMSGLIDYALDRVLGLSFRLLDVALRFLDNPLRLHLLIADGLADTLTRLAGQLVCLAYDLVRSATHVMLLDRNLIVSPGVTTRRTSLRSIA